MLSAVGFFVPGLGHILQGRWIRGAILGGVVLFMFVFGVWMGGNIFSISSTEEGFSWLLQFPPAFADMGSGLAYFISLIAGLGSSPDLAKLSTYEYGQRFILVAGLLNYLSILDCFDLAVKRKS